MSAAPDRPFRQPERAHLRKGWGQREAAVHGDLVYWGNRYTRILLSEGFRSFSPFVGVLEGRADDFSSKILIQDMSPRAWEVNMRVWSIQPLDFAWALCARYALPLHDDRGQEIQPNRIAACLGCSVALYYQRIHRGRKAYEEKLFA